MAKVGWFLALSLCFTTARADELPKIAVYDIDDTLVHVNYRTLEILREIAFLFNPALVPLATLQIGAVEYACDDTLKNVNVTDAATVLKICGNKDTYRTSEWGKRFFSAPYLRYNKVISGAPDFVEKFSKETGAMPYYLTGRDARDLGAGTLAELQYYGFPQLEPSKNILLKPAGSDQSDVDFKRQKVRDLRRQFRVIAAFDDSAANAAMFREELDRAAPVVRPVVDAASETAQASAKLGIKLITTYFYNREKVGANQSRFTVNRNQLDEIIAEAKQVP